MSHLVLVRTDAHNLLCEIAGIRYDRIGFLSDGMLWLFWALPTCANNYIGLESEFKLTGARMVTRRYIGNKDFSKALLCLDELESKSFSEQCYFEDSWICKPNGISYVNKVLVALGANEDYLAEHRLEIPFKLFEDAKHYSKSSIESSVICMDFFNFVNSNYKKFTNHKEKRFEKCARSAIDAFEHLSNVLDLSPGKNSKLSQEDVDDYVELVRNFKEVLAMSTLMKPNKEETRDQVLIVERDKSIKKKISALAFCVKNIVSRDKVLDVIKLTNCVNDILELFGKKKISIEGLPTSYLIAVIDKNRGVSKNIETGEGVIDITLDGNGLEKLTLDQLKHVLATLSVLAEDNDELIEIRKMATKLYYEMTDNKIATSSTLII